MIEHLNRSVKAELTRCSFAFKSLSDNSFVEHLKNHPIIFFLCSDGRQNIGAQGPYANSNMQLCLNLIYYLNSRNCSIALIDDVDITNAKACPVFMIAVPDFADSN